jgi:hypothetical protein
MPADEVDEHGLGEPGDRTHLLRDGERPVPLTEVREVWDRAGQHVQLARPVADPPREVEARHRQLHLLAVSVLLTHHGGEVPVSAESGGRQVAPCPSS